MNVTLRLQRWTLSVVASCVLLAAPALAETRGVAVETASDSVRFNPSGQGPWLLRLALPSGQVIEREAKLGEELMLEGRSLPGRGWADGEYVWELVAVGRSEAREPQTGGFRVIGGEFFVPAGRVDRDARVGTGTPGQEDQTVPDDLIVDGKACIGLGCVTNELFGPEALRLKQSVVRIKFEDTSTAVGAPTRDWQITANDAASGGADKFSIEDLGAATTPFTLRGGAPTNSLLVAPTGFIGSGTATPAAQLHVFGNAADVASTKLLVENVSSVAMPRELFELRNNGSVAFIFKDTSVAERWSFQGFTNRFLIDNQINSGIEYDFGPTGNLVVAGNLSAANFPSSSRTLKEDFRAIDTKSILDRLATMPVTEWSFLDDPRRLRHIGPTVEDFQATFGLGTIGQSLVITDVGGVALAAIQGLYQEMQSRNAALEARNTDLEERLAKLEEMIVALSGK